MNVEREAETVTRAADIFVPGGQPTVTYFSRDSVNQESSIKEYLETSGKALSITGPTKSGKTVGIRRILGKEGLYLSGGTLASADDFWSEIAYHLGQYGEEEILLSNTETEAVTGSGEVGNIIAKAALEGSKSDEVTRSRLQRRNVPLQVIASDQLRALRRPVVIDDFHYIDRSVQTKLIRAIRPLLFDGVPFIFISVPHRGDDAVRAEPELNGRVEGLKIPLWEEHELLGIAESGFKALNVRPSEDILAIFSLQASGSPHLMQDFCLRACRRLGVTERTTTPTRLTIAESEREGFFSDCAADAFSRVAMDKLIRGPQNRSDRKQRRTRYGSGDGIDIYRAMVLALCRFGPRESVSYNEIRTELRSILLDEDVPQKHEITRVLKKMHEIAASAPGEPVMEWDNEDGILYITDPFFSFLLRFLTGGVRA